MQENKTTEENCFRRVDEATRTDKNSVVEVTEDDYWYALETVPPVYGKRCFGMGEVAQHNPQGAEMFYCFAQIEKKFFACLQTIDEASRLFQAKRNALSVYAKESKESPITEDGLTANNWATGNPYTS